MKNPEKEIKEAVKDFIEVAKLASVFIKPEELEIEYLKAPHSPPTFLPKNKMAIYGFCFEGQWLIVGMAGPKSSARYTSHHYNPKSSLSNLAKKLLKDSEMKLIIRDNPGDWIKKNCDRVNIIIDAEKGILLLALFEAFLHVRLRPIYEK
ncbi:MAG: hypothetical protein H5U05_09360 [Candidatus Aminicenantes bacterium]|nr:hypothetical protein [Candidatus Aminicenantes bacterium]